MSNLFNELKRRNVFRVGIAYVVVGWVLAQVAEYSTDTFGAPDWVLKIFTVFLLLGFPLALIFAWAFEMTPEGLKLEKDVDRSRSISNQTGRKLDYLVISLLAVAVTYFAIDKFVLAPGVSRANAVVETQTATTQERSLAVLPFVNMSGDQENEYFADGLSEELLNALSQLRGLQVAGRTSSFFYKGKNEDLRNIGKTLGVANILEGSIRRQGDKVRITAQLIRAEDGFHLWSETYNRTMDDVFVIQDDIAESVARALNVILDENSRQRMQNAGVRNVDAFIAYQKAMDLFSKAHLAANSPGQIATGLEEALPLLRTAQALVPNFASAHYAEADLYAHRMMASSDPATLRQALADYDRTLANAHEAAQDPAVRALIMVDRVLFSDDWRTLPGHLENVFASADCSVELWFGQIQALGYREQSLEYLRNKVACDPLYDFHHVRLVNTYLYLGRYDEALAALRQAYSKVGGNEWLRSLEARALAARGDIDGALRVSRALSHDNYISGITHLSILTFKEPLERIHEIANEYRELLDGSVDLQLKYFAFTGDHDAANALAAEMDARPGGHMQLMVGITQCQCGAPFDLEYTPNLAARLEEAGFNWPPPTVNDFPLKDW